MSGFAAGGTLRHAARHHLARSGPGKSRYAHVGSREEGRRPAAEAHSADDRVLPASAVRRDSRPGRDPGDGAAVKTINQLVPPAARAIGFGFGVSLLRASILRK